MNGKDLKKIIDDVMGKTKRSASDIIAKSKIKSRTYYKLFEKDEVEEFYLERLRAAGIDVPNSALQINLSQSALQENSNQDYKLKTDVTTLLRLQEMQEIIIKENTKKILALEEKVIHLETQLTNFYAEQKRRVQQVPDRASTKKT